MRGMETHRFFCPRCGEEGIPLARPNGKKREKHHLKMLYCYHCKMTLNHIECRNDQEVKEFLEKFKTGELAKIVDESEIK
jgi:phage terminase large subunit GpA-like protein